MIDTERILLCIFVFIFALFVLLFVCAPALNDAFDDVIDSIYENMKLCVTCNNIEATDTATCSECGSSDFALTWCTKCYTAFDTVPAYCPTCGKKQ